MNSRFNPLGLITFLSIYSSNNKIYPVQYKNYREMYLIQWGFSRVVKTVAKKWSKKQLNKINCVATKKFE